MPARRPHAQATTAAIARSITSCDHMSRTVVDRTLPPSITSIAATITGGYSTAKSRYGRPSWLAILS